MLMQTADLVIIGAGPAGMAAAATAAGCGLTVMVLDEQAAPGGQIYRDVERVAPLRGNILGQDYSDGLTLVQDFGKAGVTHLDGAVVWAIEDGKGVCYTRNGKAANIEASRILLATGALERPMPVPGWTLPGVMTAGAAQILMKQSGLVPASAVLAGSGPLLYLLAAQMVRAGTPPKALIETQSLKDMMTAMPHLAGALRGWRYMAKGLGLLGELRKAGVPRHTGARAIAIEGETCATAIRFEAGGRQHRIDCETVLLHHGVVPNTQASRSIGSTHRWNDRQQCFEPVLDEWGRSSVDSAFVAGDGAGIGGANAAALAGRLAALAIACDLGKITVASRDARAAPLRRALAGELAARPFIDLAYPPYASALLPEDRTIVCRCEEVTAGDIRNYARLGCLGPNQAKAFGRAGMGPCQGRYCGLTVTSILADANAATPEQTGYFRIRPPIKPVTLGELAELNTAPRGDNRTESH
jgi:NADPH-dependent 2,4-dienoyl-CoA reductase/sulfur reductase-like enzyme